MRLGGYAGDCDMLMSPRPETIANENRMDVCTLLLLPLLYVCTLPSIELGQPEPMCLSSRRDM
jgi:hypothetical protein